ncbi:hypothetical protein ACTWQB_09170 [Piscibacillus sp. B03]|uniref:hypothetical protein n=1 Tax=Piscibacillus sp. B03 TaxID=3457430 RepID=UPI003FCE9F82
MSFFKLSLAELSELFLIAVVLVLIMTGIKYITKWRQLDRTVLMLFVMTTASFLFLSSFDSYTFSALWRGFLVLTFISVVLNYFFNMAVESKLIEKEKQIDWREGKRLSKGALIGGGLLLVGFIVFTIWYTQPQQFDKTVEGVHFQLGNLEAEELVEVEIDGEITRTIAGGALFEGKYTVEGTKIELPGEENVEAYIDYRKSNGQYGTFFYYDSDIGSPGQIFIRDDFEQFVITRYQDHSWSSEDGWIISAPAQGREEALDLARELTGYELE